MTITKFEQQADSTRAPEHKGLNFQNAISKTDWEQHVSKSTSRSSALPTELTFDNPYGDANASAAGPNQGLNKDLSNLKHDVSVLESSKKGDANYNTALTDLKTTEQALKEDVFTLKKNSSDFKDFADVMNQYHTELKSVATDLWHMGLKKEASETTAYYPLSHYEHEFAERGKHGGGSGGGTGGSGGTGGGDGGGGTGDGGIAPPKGSVLTSGLDNTNNEQLNTKAGEIGGSGAIDSATVTQTGADSVHFNVKGGAWGDALWLTRVKNSSTLPVKDFHVQLDDKISFTASELKNNHEIEKDIYGPWGMAGTEINSQTGKVDFWNAAASKWVTVGSLGPLQANKTYDLQIGVSSMGDPKNGTYKFDYYSLNGDVLKASQNTFNDKNLGWSPGIYIQTQLDLPGNPTGDAGMTESDQHIYVS